MATTGYPTTDESKSETQTWVNLHGFKRDILVTMAEIESDHVSEDVCYGLAIKRQLEDDYEGEVNHGRLYPNLDDLVEEGLVGKREFDKRTNRYNLTDAGRNLLAQRAKRFAKFDQ